MDNSPPYLALAFFGLCALVFLWQMTKGTRQHRRESNPADPLDHVLFPWTVHDPFTVRDLLNGVCIMGRVGSGKTSSSARILGTSIVRYPKSGGLILAAKPEDLAMWKAIFKDAGREGDLKVFSPAESWRLNCVDYIIKSGGTAKDITKFLLCVGETLRSSDSDGTEDASFWQKQNERMIYLAVVVLWIAYKSITVPALHMFISGAAGSMADMQMESWQKGFHHQTFLLAAKAEKTEIEKHDFTLAADYFLQELPTTADRTRSSILVGVYGILHTYNSSHARILLSTETNISPDDALAGKWILINMAPSEWGDMGCLVNSAWKFLMQRRILRREAKPDDYINIIFADESHQFVNSADSHYLAQCRSHLGSMVYITQSVSSFYGILASEKGKHIADALFANFTTTIVHACDPITAEWASAKMGKKLEVFVGTSSPPMQNMFEEMLGLSRVTYNTSEHYEPWIQPRLLMNGLRTGGKAAGYVCDGVVLKSGEPFSDGKNYLFTGFSQK